MKSKADQHHFGIFGGRYVPEVLIQALDELEDAFSKHWKQKQFRNKVDSILKVYVGRPSPLTPCGSLSAKLKTNVFLKREDLLHTGAHKINNTIGQVLLAKAMGKKRIIAETGAGQHGVAIATACALFDMPCVVYMGAKDIQRQSLNVFRMKLMGAEVIPVLSGSQTLKDAVNEAIRDWIKNVKDTLYVLGSAVGPAPFPMMVREFQSVIGKEVKQQLKGAPDLIVACVGGGSNSIGIFHPFLKSKAKMIGVEAAGKGLNSHFQAATLTKGKIGVLHGAKSYVLQTPEGQIQEAHSISAGLDYPGVGPEHAFLKETKRVSYVSATDEDALHGFQYLSRNEGIIPALESSHAIGYLLKHPKSVAKCKSVVICLSGRGDKDVEQVSKILRVQS